MPEQANLVWAHRHWWNLEITGVKLPGKGPLIRAGEQVLDTQDDIHKRLDGFCKNIRAYSEPGEMGVVLWLEIELNFADNIRMPARQAEYIQSTRHKEVKKHDQAAPTVAP